MGVGGIDSHEKADEASVYGYDMVEIGKSIIMNPDWVARVKANKPLRYSIKLSELKSLYIPSGLMKKIKENEGWFKLID